MQNRMAKATQSITFMKPPSLEDPGLGHIGLKTCDQKKVPKWDREKKVKRAPKPRRENKQPPKDSKMGEKKGKRAPKPRRANKQPPKGSKMGEKKR